MLYKGDSRAGICASDLHIKLVGAESCGRELLVGHERSVSLVLFGEAVKTVKPGAERVASDGWRRSAASLVSFLAVIGWSTIAYIRIGGWALGVRI